MTESERDEESNANADPDADGTEPTESDSSAADDPASEPTLGASVVTIASNRSLDSDAAGAAIEDALEEAGHDLATREHVAPDHDRVQSIVLRMIERDDVDIVITAGATSVEPDDVVIEAVEPLLDKELTAFRELFTSMAYEAVGTRVVAARTLAGVAEGKPVFCLPGNGGAAQLATEEIILPEARYLIDLARPDDADEDEDEAGDESDDEDDGDSESSSD